MVSGIDAPIANTCVSTFSVTVDDRQQMSTSSAISNTKRARLADEDLEIQIACLDLYNTHHLTKCGYDDERTAGGKNTMVSAAKTDETCGTY